MRGLWLVFIVCFAVSLPLGATQVYLREFFVGQDGTRAEKEKRYLDALVDFEDERDCLRILQAKEPDFEAPLVKKRIAELEADVARLKPPATDEVLAKFGRKLSSGPPISMMYDDGVRLEAAHQDGDALIAFEKYRKTLEIVHEHFPDWEKSLIETRLADSGDKIKRLQDRVAPPVRTGTGTVQ